MTNGTIFCNQCGGQNSTTARFCAHCGAGLEAPSNTATATIPVLSEYSAVPIGMLNAVGTPARYGGFWIRFVAAVIDGIVVQAVVMPVAFVAGIVLSAIGMASNSAGQRFNVITGIPILFLGMFGLLASWIYEAAMESSSRQATLGKMIFSLKVTDLQGRRIAFARATARHFSKYLSGIILMLGYIMAGFTAQKQALHDMIAGTVVRSN